MHLHGGALARWPDKFGGNNVGFCGELDSTMLNRLEALFRLHRSDFQLLVMDSIHLFFMVFVIIT